ncbi:MAG: carbamoyl-phosphate synthase large subunit, partial [Ruminococcus sp.]|nr:carbamoyl-phosphate synthase large subunit [Ruminococcus sp.]
SALASKATGYPIAKTAAKIAVGYTLDEIINQVTGKTYACFEPALDYVVIKFPKWAFDKFVYARRTLGTQMKATGEVMAIGTSFEQAIMKAVRSIELGLDTMSMRKFADMTPEQLREKLHDIDDERSFVVFEALKKGITPEEIHEITMIDNWFLYKLLNLAELEKWLAEGELTEEKYDTAKQYGYLDSTIERLSGQICPKHKSAVFKMVDTCAGEFKAETPYFYSTFDDENEAEQFIERQNTGKKKVIVFGSGPIRIGQGIEFDYCSVHCVWTLKELGYEAVICNNNPETVSTDFDTGDRLYFDPLTKEDVEAIIETEKPYGVVVQFGGQTAIKLTRYLSDMGVNILGTSADMIDAAEDRERFDEVLEKCGIPRPAGHTVMTTDEAVKVAEQLGYPVLLRPSYVLGGQNMIIAHSKSDVIEYMGIITSHMIENPVLIDKYMMGTEVEVDAICDGEDFLIPGIMEHIERAGVHSGDSISIYPAQHLSERIKRIIVEYTRKLAKELNVIGLVNIQYVVYNHEVFVIEVNPRSSRTVPYISKVTGIPMVDIATRIMFGTKLRDMGYESGLYPSGDYVAVKVPVFSFEKLTDVDTMLGPEMKSTGECLGIGRNLEDALLKGLI